VYIATTKNNAWKQVGGNNNEKNVAMKLTPRKFAGEKRRDSTDIAEIFGRKIARHYERSLIRYLLYLQARDSDGDGISDEDDLDDDNDGIPDAEDPDDDNDGIPDLGIHKAHAQQCVFPYF
jgi:hypothetical protein